MPATGLIDADHRRRGIAQLRGHTHVQVLRLAREVRLAVHATSAAEPRILNSCICQHAALDLRRGVDAVPLESLGEHVAKIQRDALRQHLQAHQRHQLTDAGIDLQELSVARHAASALPVRLA